MYETDEVLSDYIKDRTRKLYINFLRYKYIFLSIHDPPK